MLMTISSFSCKLIRICILLLIVIFPLVSFRIHIQSAIFPALETIVIYFFLENIKMRNFGAILCGLFVDQISLMPTGYNSFSLLCGNIFLRFVNKRFLVKSYKINIIIFGGYILTIFTSKYLIFVSQNHYIKPLGIILQLLTTLVAYPFLESLLSKLYSANKKT